MRRTFLLAMGLALGSTATVWGDARSDFMEAAEHQKAQRWGEAAQAYAKVTAQAPTYAPAWKQLATCRFYLGDLEGAEASAQRYLKLQPTDSAFTAWDAQLRNKLKLPPLDLNTPVPTPVPTQMPVDGAVTLAPAPSADAEVVDASAVAPATEFMVVADESAAATAEASSSTSSPSSTFGLRLAGSFSLGLGRFEHGEQVNSSTTPSNKPYSGQAGLGLGGLAELLWDRGERLELSLGAYPIQWQETQSSSRTDSFTRSDESSAKSLLLPILLGAGARFPLSPLVTGILSAGLGVIPSAHVDVDKSTVQTATSSLTNTRIKAALDYGLAPAWRIAAALEVPVSKAGSIFLGGQLLGAQFSDTKGSYTYEVLDQSGNVLFSGSGVTTKGQALSVLSASALLGFSARF